MYSFLLTVLLLWWSDFCNIGVFLHPPPPPHQSALQYSCFSLKHVRLECGRHGLHWKKKKKVATNYPVTDSLEWGWAWIEYEIFFWDFMYIFFQWRTYLFYTRPSVLFCRSQTYTANTHERVPEREKTFCWKTK